ncbi:glycosyltransferase family 4 protein [Microcoleus anatoxicus]|uniref:Glycosyltransferase family 4 protein n=1 Tax=Microcoleus anatoxicus PTRS2 TaxID=2705321 RepID=A0ABU8YRZ6_9CYAN|nr:MAG: glycosyltransferase [Oscillatoriales cyanobacterium]
MEQQKTVGFLLKRVDCNDGVASHCETLMRGFKAVGWRVVLITGPVNYDASSEKSFQALKDLSEDWIIFEDLKPFWPTSASISRIKLEGCALVVAEAMCSGTVPIRTPAGGVLDQIEEGKTGYIVPFDDAEALSKAIQKLVNKDFRLQMGQQCAEYASSVFDRELMIEKTVELYCECSDMETK